jgi:C4-dicarboxylate-specific signal transduction histidine kinase
LQQVLLNLILNGCEAMASTRGASRQLVVTASTEARLVQLSVRDFGTGIPPELMGRLFEPFVTTKSDGLGLGLSISRTIVTAHGGRLWAENNADGGATVHFVVPSTASRAIASPAIASVLARYHQP